MSSWETILDNFPPEDQLELTEEEQAYMPVYTTNAFAADYKDTRCLFALFQTLAIWCKGVGTIWKFTSDNTELTTRKFQFLVQHLDKIENFDFIQQTTTYNNKQIKWDTLYPKWKYLNNRKVHFQSLSTSEAEETKPSIPGEFEEEESDKSERSNKSDKSEEESEHSKSPIPEDNNIAKVDKLLQQTEATVAPAIQKLASRPSTPSPQETPLCQTSMLPGSSKLSIPEESSLPTPPVSKGKGKQVPPPQTLASALRSLQASPVPTTTQPETPQLPKGNTKGILLQIPSHWPCSGRTGPPQRPPSPLNPPAVMAGNVTTPKLLGSTPDPYDGNPAKAQAFWNTLANYYTMNSAVYTTNNKKVPAALTNFKTGTQGGDWASNYIAEALGVTPVNYGTWAQFKTAFQKQFIPPEVQQEAIKGMHDMYMGNCKFNDWYQDWTYHA